MILKWNEFKDDFIFESLINETYVYYINDFKDIQIYKIKNENKNLIYKL
jgi:hypothetical protein